MKLEQYDKIFECLNQLRSEINIEAIPKTEEKDVKPSPEVDIILLTVEKINSCKVNVFMDNEVNWEEVTMFNMDNIKRLLNLVENQFISDVGDAIISALSGKYDPSWPYYKPEVHSDYYNPSTATLPEEGDWDYAATINIYIDSLKQKRQKAEAYQKKLNANKAADEFLYNSAETFISKLNQDPEFTNKMAIVPKKELERLKDIESQFETLKNSREIKMESESDNEEETLETSFTATPRQTILLFKELGYDYTNASMYNKTKVKKMLSILTTKTEGNINKKLSQIDYSNKYVQNDLEIIKQLLEDIKK